MTTNPPKNHELFDLYFRYVEDTEAPIIYHRWSLLTGVGAFLGRQFYLSTGLGRTFPNMYTMLVGNPGTRKSSAIKTSRRMLSTAGYSTFSADRTTKEKFLLDLEGITDEDEYLAKVGGRAKKRDESPRDILESLGLVTGDSGHDGIPKEVFIVADEFNEFAGTGNIDFLSTLGSLWDWDDENLTYKQRFKNSKSISIFQPTISLLGGNTHTSLQATFPAAAIGQGFLSRLILVHSEPSGRKITFPRKPDESIAVRMGELFNTIRNEVKGEATFTKMAEQALDTIYRTWKDIEDYRFKHYSTRRFTHLQKLCMITAACRLSVKIDIQDVILANTILTFTEKDMPKALGEYGKDPNSEAKQNLMAHLYEAKEPQSYNQLYKVVQRDILKQSMMPELIASLMHAGKIQEVPIGHTKGYLAKQKPVDDRASYVDLKLLKEARPR